LGRITFKIRDIFLNNKHSNTEKTSRKRIAFDKQTLTDHGDNEEDCETSVKQCRICLSDTNSISQQSLKNCDKINDKNGENRDKINDKSGENCDKINDKNGENCDKNFENLEKVKNPEEDNPFISPCRCSGTMKFIHVKCLQFWLASKIQIKQSSDCCKSLSWKNIECELCKFEFPSKLSIIKDFSFDFFIEKSGNF